MTALCIVLAVVVFLIVVEVCDAWARLEYQRVRLRARPHDCPNCKPDYEDGDLVKEDEAW